jgi:hypothetical protein
MLEDNTCNFLFYFLKDMKNQFWEAVQISELCISWEKTRGNFKIIKLYTVFQYLRIHAKL